MQKVRVLSIFWLLLLSGSVLLAVAPSWWSDTGTQIIEEEGSEENYAPANLGQLKHVAKMAKEHLDESVAGGAGSTITTMVAGFEPRAGMGYTQPQIDVFLAENYAPINLGQLKAVAKPFYDRLKEAGYDTKANLIARGYPGGWEFDYPWDPETALEENYAPANLGQLKMVFSFDLASYDTDLDGLPDEWELSYFTDLESDEAGDLDGDGYSNLEEYQQGTDPTYYYSQGGRDITPIVSILGGDGQSGPAGQYLADALEVAVWASDTGEMLANAPVVFSTLRGGAGLSATKGLVSTTSIREVYTGTAGTAKAYAQPANAGVSVVQAAAAGAGDPVEFSINNQDVPTEGLKVWLKADTGLQVLGQQVVSWQDQSGDSRTATQSTEAARPTLVSEALNGKPSVRFDGVDDALGGALGYNGGSADITIVSVHRRTGSTYWGAPVSLSSSQYGTPILTWKNATWELGANNVGVNDTGVYVNSGSTSRGRYLLSSVSRAGGTNGNGGTLSVRSFDGHTALASSGTQTWASGTTSGYYLGRHWSADPSTSLKGEVAEVLIYNRALTTDELEQIEWYLKDKYALEDSDEDGMQDGWETQYGLDPYFADDAGNDDDGDGLTNLQEFQQGSDPTNRYDGVTYTLAINDGNNQSGSGYLTDPLEVVVSGSGSVGIEGASVTFRVTSGPGEIATENPGDLGEELEVQTDEDGLARVYLNVTGTAVVMVKAEAGAKSVEFLANAPTSGMKMWLRADAGISSSASGKVSQWADQSGNGMPAGNTYAPQQPLLVENAVHGKPALRFDGVDDVFTGTTNYNPSGGDFTILAVHRRATVTEWNSPLSFSTSWTSLGAPLLTYKYSESNFGICDVGRDANGVYVSAGTMGLNRFSVASLTRSGGTSGNGGTLSLKMSNGPVTLTSSGTQTWTSGTATGFYIGQQYISSPVVMKGDIAELIVYNRVLTSGELAQMEDYLQTKYALRDSDTDGMADWWEEQNGLVVGTNDAALDADGDGISNLAEFLQNGDPQDYYNRGSAGAAVTPTLAIDSGNDQTGLINQFLQKPLVVKVTGTGTTPLVNAPVTFQVTNGGGAVAANPGPSEATTLTVQTGSTGLAQIFYRQGTEKAVGNTIVATTGTSSVIFQTMTSDDEVGLVGQWRFDEGSGLSVADESGFVNTGTLGANGPVFGDAINSGSSLEFDGTGDDDAYVIDGPNTGVLNFGKGSFSLSFWFKSDDAGHGRLVGNGAWGGFKGYSVKLTRNASNQYGKLGFYLTSSGTNVASAADLGVTTLNTFNDNEWHHVAAVVDREQGKVMMYVDGVSQEFDSGISSGTGLVLTSGTAGANISGMTTLQADSGERMRFGQFGLVGDPYEGLLDEVQVYGRALTEEEIQELFKREGPLEAIDQEVALNEDTVGTIVLRHRGGGEKGTAIYEIVEDPEEGGAEVEGDRVTYFPKGHFSGTDTFRFRVTKNGGTSEADVNLTIGAVDDAPLVSVGSGQSITLPAVANLTGVVTDIDTDPENISVFWMKLSGPGDVDFSNQNSLATTATFSQSGQYIIRLIANDGASMRSDSLVIWVNAEESTDLPAVDIEEPGDNEIFEPSSSIRLAASSVAAGGRTISKCEFFEGSRKIGESLAPDTTSGLYEVSWTPDHLGYFTISVLATDSSGLKAFSDPVIIVVTTGGWFAPGGNSGNEGWSGSGGDGGMAGGVDTSPESPHGWINAGPGTSANSSRPEPINDADDDGLVDEKDAVPYHRLMKVPAAPNCNFMVVELGEVSSVGTPSGVNDKGEVLLTKASGNPLLVSGFVYRGGAIIPIGDGEDFYGPLQDGRVFYRLESERPSPEDPYQEFSMLKVWPTGALLGRAWENVGYDGDLTSAPTYASFVNMDLLSIPPAPISAGIKTTFSEALPGPSGGDDTHSVSMSASVRIANDAGKKVFAAGKGASTHYSSTLPPTQIEHYINSIIAGWDDTVAIKGWSSERYNYANDTHVSWAASGDDALNVVINNQGFAAATLMEKRADETFPNMRGAAFVGGEWLDIPGSSEVLDITETNIANEGPYFLTKSGSVSQLVAYRDASFPRFTIGPEINANHEISGRKISKNLVIPLGDAIWRNGFKEMLKNIVSPEAGLSNFSFKLTSPNNGIMVGTAMKEGAERAVLLAPIEFNVVWNPRVKVPDPEVDIQDPSKYYATAAIALGKDDTFSMSATVQIKIIGVSANSQMADVEASKWKVKTLQNIVASKPSTGVYEGRTETNTVYPIPCMDQGDSPFSEKQFRKNLTSETVVHADSPKSGWPIWDLQPSNTIPKDVIRIPGLNPLLSAERDDVFITWVYVEREGGRKIFLKWFKWRAAYKLNFNSSYSNGVTSAPYTKTVWEYKKIAEGDGEGPIKPTFIPRNVKINSQY